MTPTEIAMLAAGLAVGGIIAWFWSASRARSGASSGLAELQNRIGAADSTIESLRRQLETSSAELIALRETLQSERDESVTARTRLEESQKNIEQQRQLLDGAEKRLKETFGTLSLDAQRKYSEVFARQADEKVKPLRDALERFEQQVRGLEQSRREAYGGINQALVAMKATHEKLQQETASLATALRTPQAKGRWGELQLRRTVEVAGMSPHCDFIEQPSTDGDDGQRRPDLIVKLPGDRTVVIDSKISTDSYLEALQAETDGERRQHMARYVRALRTHIQSLSSKAYWTQFEPTPDFVVMFVPGESFFSAALEQDAGLIDNAMKNRVILASPTTLIALLRTVAYSWQQQQLVENARQIGETAKYLYDRVCTFSEHLDNVGDGLRRAVKAYNSSVGSWISRVVPMGRRIGELGVTAGDAEFPQLNPVSETPRELPEAASRERLTMDNETE